MNISSVVNQINENLTNRGMDTAFHTEGMENGLSRGLQSVLKMPAGTVISGEVIFVDGSDILLSLGKGELLNAKMEGNLVPKEGQVMSFQLHASGNSKVSLTPLYANLNQNPTIANALSNAGLPKSDINAYMVKSMMEEGLPIDKQSLLQMNKAVMLNSDTDVAVLAQMHRLNLPLEPATISQFQQYMNYEHAITGSIYEISNSFSETLSTLAGDNGIQDALMFAKEVLDSLLKNHFEESFDTMENEERVNENSDNFNSKESNALSGNLLNISLDGKELEEGKSLDNSENGGNAIRSLENEKMNSQAMAMKNAGFSDEDMNHMIQGKISSTELFDKLSKQINDALQQGNSSKNESLFHIIKGKEFAEQLSKHLEKEFLLKPKDVAQESRVDKLYEKLNNQTKELVDLLTKSNRMDTPMANTVTNLNSNLDFMNQLNQTFQYIQIPLKMQNGENTGELFVYTNKKNLASQDGNISALLHLDMDYLGPTDVHVMMNEQGHVGTKFYLKDDAALDLVAEHIDELTQRLNQRGYQMTSELLMKEKPTNMMEEILEQNKNISVLSQYAFDARA